MKSPETLTVDELHEALARCTNALFGLREYTQLNTDDVRRVESLKAQVQGSIDSALDDFENVSLWMKGRDELMQVEGIRLFLHYLVDSKQSLDIHNAVGLLNAVQWSLEEGDSKILDYFRGIKTKGVQ